MGTEMHSFGGAPSPALRFHVVCAVSDKAVLHANWLAPQSDGASIARGAREAPAFAAWAGATLVHRPASAGAAFNSLARRLLRSAATNQVAGTTGSAGTTARAVPAGQAGYGGDEVQTEPPAQDWLVWVHQDVRWPRGWCGQFHEALQEALALWPNLAVAGVYGLTGWGEAATRAGEVCDRGQWLREAPALPCPASSLDELLVAVRVDSGLLMDEALGFDFYATDLCLQARARGFSAAVLKAPCHHASGTPRSGPAAASTLSRIQRSADVFEQKWAAALPVFTPCFEIRQPGDVRAFITQHFEATGDA